MPKLLSLPSHTSNSIKEIREMALVPPEQPGAANQSALDRSSRGAISLSWYGAYWGAKGGAALTPFGYTPWTFGKWVADPKKPHFPGYSQISMNCWEWTSLGALKAGATTREQVSAWLKRIDHARGMVEKNQAVFGGDSQALSVTYKNAGEGRYRAELSQQSPLPRPGQLITVDGTDHVLIVTGVKHGEVYVASFPEIPFGEIVTGSGLYTKPYAGKLTDWLTKNINYYPGDVNNTDSWLRAQLRFGDPGFLKR